MLTMAHTNFTLPSYVGEMQTQAEQVYGKASLLKVAS